MTRSRGRKSRRNKNRNLQRISRRASLEQLEQRQLLAADTVAIPRNVDAITHEMPSVVDTIDKPAFSVDVEIGSDFYYFADGQRIDLIPVDNEFVVGTNADSLDLPSLLTADFESHTLSAQPFGGNKLTVSLLSETDGPLERTVGAELGVSSDSLWSAPVFRNMTTSMLQWPTTEIIVALEEGVDAESYFDDSRFSSYRSLLGTHDQFIATVATGGALEAMRLSNEVLPNDSAVKWATVDFVVEGQSELLPNDALFGSQWALRNTGQTGGTSGADAFFDGAWDVTTGDSKVVIAIFDSGVQTNHPDIDIWTNPNEGCR